MVEQYRVTDLTDDKDGCRLYSIQKLDPDPVSVGPHRGFSPRHALEVYFEENPHLLSKWGIVEEGK